MRKTLITALILTGCFSITVQAASFDCTKASSATEKLICSNDTISKLDEQLANSYKQALEAATDKDAFKKTQVEWLKQQRTCKDAECLTQAYQARIGELNKKDVTIEKKSLSAEKELTYKPNYKRVEIKNLLPEGYSTKSARPTNMFQIAASNDDKLCGDVLKVLNQAGTYQGEDKVYWWVSNSNLAKWSVTKNGSSDENFSQENYIPGQLEEFIADIDGDNVQEYSYRVNVSVHGAYFQNIAIFSADLKNDNSMDLPYLDWECRAISKASCEAMKKEFDKKNRLMDFVLAPIDTPLKNRWVSMTTGYNFSVGDPFIESFYRKKNNSISKTSWWTTFVKIGSNYGIILYPQELEQLEIIYGSLSKNNPINHQCIFAPQISQH